MRARTLLTALASVVLLTACSSGTDATPPQVDLTFQASTWTPAQGDVVVFGVTASVSRGDITLCEIWYGDGSLDIQYFKSAAISTTFSHSYSSPGMYTVTVGIQNESGEIYHSAVGTINVGASR